MRRVVIFLDGKNFYRGLQEANVAREIDFSTFARWVVAEAGGDDLGAAHYYTGVYAEEADARGPALDRFLSYVEMQNGFFVHRFSRRTVVRTCPRCNADIDFTQEKEVDTRIVADMVSLAARRAMEIAILVSGDQDMAPALDALRDLGVKAYVATWGGHGLSRRLRTAAFGHIDLLAGLDTFGKVVVREEGTRDPLVVEGTGGDPAGHPLPDEAATTPGLNEGPTPEPDPLHLPMPIAAPGPHSVTSIGDDDDLLLFLSELRRAQRHFEPSGGFVGAHYFLTKWRSPNASFAPEQRPDLLRRALLAHLVEEFRNDDGEAVLRCADTMEAQQVA